jgi:hypothetical protein
MQKLPWKWRVARTVLTNFSPLASVRIAGPYGPSLIERFRSDIAAKFAHLFDDSSCISRYIYHLNARDPSGEIAFATLTSGNDRQTNTTAVVQRW